MILGDRLHTIREAKQLSLQDIAKRTGLSPSYVMRVENGHAVPDIKTLEKWAAALEVRVHELFYESGRPPELLNLRNRLTADDIIRASLGKMLIFLIRLH